jgi:hypothetical protein
MLLAIPSFILMRVQRQWPMSLRDSRGNPYLLLLKLGQKEHLEMLRKGKLYMNTLAYFTTLDSDPARADPYEGTDSIIQPRHIGEFIIDPNLPGMKPLKVLPSELAGPVRISMNRTRTCNVFCMFAVNTPIEGSIFPNSNEWFGDSFVLFKNTPEFLSRIKTAAERSGFAVSAGMIEYYDEAIYSGKTGRFRKQSHFAHQREFRVILESTLNAPLVFDLGDLTDITSEVHSFEDADAILKFSPEDASEAGLSWE